MVKIIQWIKKNKISMKLTVECFDKVKKDCLNFIKSQETKADRFKNKERMIKSYLIPLCFWINKKADNNNSYNSINRNNNCNSNDIKSNKSKISSLKKDTLQIAEQLVAVPAGSPLLEQLRRVTPAAIQLQDVSVQNDRIKISGKAAVGTTPGPLERINALAITLARLPISKPDGVKVLKLTRDDGDTPVVNFSLDWGLDPKAGPSIKQLEALGADGLAERYRLLEQQGVPL